jgi:hypothetical protein
MLAKLRGIRTVVREAIADAVGPEAVSEPDTFQPHVTLVYSNDEQETESSFVVSMKPRTHLPQSLSTGQHSSTSTGTTKRYGWRTITTVPLAQLRQ